MITVICIAAIVMGGVVSLIALASRSGDIEVSATTNIVLAASILFMSAGLLGLLLFNAQ